MQKRMSAILEQVDSNAATILENKNELAEISRRLNDLESKSTVTMTDNNATVQEIRENLTFMNDQILRLDSSMRTQRPSASRPGPASVFKPGGFDVNASYKGSLDEYYSRRYESAISGFTELLTVAPNNSLADNHSTGSVNAIMLSIIMKRHWMRFKKCLTFLTATNSPMPR